MIEIRPGFDVDAYCEKLAQAGTEHAHQRAFFGWLNFAQVSGQHDRAHLAYAIPNGGKRDAVTAARLKAEGVKAGVPDVHYPVPRFTAEGQILNAGLWIEMKKPGEGVLSIAQQDRHADLRQCGHSVATCWGWRQARAAFTDYAAGRPVALEYT